MCRISLYIETAFSNVYCYLQVNLLGEMENRTVPEMMCSGLSSVFLLVCRGWKV